MKIQFKDSWGDVEEYPIYSISYSMEGGEPIDIIIAGYTEVLVEIAEKHGRLGFNIREYDDCEAELFGIEAEALYGRLECFKVVNPYQVKMICKPSSDA